MRRKLILLALLIFLISGCTTRDQEIFISESRVVKIKVVDPPGMVPVIRSILERFGGVVTNSYIPHHSLSLLDWARIDASIPADNLEKALDEILQDAVVVIDVQSSVHDRTASVKEDRQRLQELYDAEAELVDRMNNPNHSIEKILLLREEIEAIREEINLMQGRAGYHYSEEPFSSVHFEIYPLTMIE